MQFKNLGKIEITNCSPKNVFQVWVINAKILWQEKPSPSQSSLLQSHEPFDGSITIKIRFWTCAILDNKQFSLSLVCVNFFHSVVSRSSCFWSIEYLCYIIAYREQYYVVYKNCKSKQQSTSYVMNKLLVLFAKKHSV